MIFINMKKKFTSKQLQEIESKLLNEQYMPYPGYGTAKGTIEYAKTIKELDHDVAMIMSIVSAFIPIVGPAISAGWMALDAAQYHKEGNDQMAGLMLLFAALPGFGAGARLAAGPILAKMGLVSRRKLAQKIIAHQAGKEVAFTKAEKIVLHDISSNPKLIEQEMRREAARQTAKKSLTKKAGTALLKGSAQFAKYQAIAEAWFALYGEIGLDVAKMQASLRPMLENIKRAVQMEMRPELTKAATPGMNTGIFSRLPKFEQIVREEYQAIKEGIEDDDAKTPKKDYSKVQVPFISTADLERYRQHFAKRASALGADVKKDYDRLKSKMTGASTTNADKEFYSLHKSLVDRWWNAELVRAEKEREESGAMDWAYWIQWGTWSSMMWKVFGWIGDNWKAIATILTAIGLYRRARNNRGGGRTGSVSVASIGEAKAISKFFSILPRLKRGQIKKLLEQLGADTTKLTTEELEALTRKIRGSEDLFRRQLEEIVMKNRLQAVHELINTSDPRFASILRGWLTPAEHKAYNKYIEEYIRLTKKYGNATWATKWFR